MMKRHTITLGASTTAGGKVISASSHGSIHGIPIALECDTIICKGCKGPGRIVCVGPRIPETWGGKQVALENDLCACGCSPPPRLLANQTVRYQMLSNGEAAHASASSASGAAAMGADLSGDASKPHFDDKFILVDDIGGEPLPHTEYAIVRSTGKVEFGTNGDGGQTHLLAATAETEHVEIYT